MQAVKDNGPSEVLFPPLSIFTVHLHSSFIVICRRVVVCILFLYIFSLNQNALASDSGADSLQWDEIQSGLHMAVIKDPVYCRVGSKITTVVKIDPERFRFEAFQYSAESLNGPLTIEDWSRKTGAPVVFNAGQYYENLKHMGLLIKNGVNLGTPLISRWKALFVENSAETGSGQVSLLDLEFENADASGRTYSFAVQSLMLFDRTGAKRVRQSDWVANRTILATDWKGMVYVFCTQGGYTLWEAADFIKKLGLQLKHAMNLDGGYQSQLTINTPYFTYTSYGRWVIQGNKTGLSMPGVKLKLPAIIAVFPRKQ